MSPGQHYRIPSRDHDRSYVVSVPSSDIEKCISFNVLSLVFSVASLLLLVSDVPRSGTGIFKLDGWLRQVQPDTAIFFGPFSFHTARILLLPVVNSSGRNISEQVEYKGFLDGDTIDSAALWSYKFDSMSVPQRALAKALNVNAYPPCVLYKRKCPSKQLSLKDTFLMLDALIEAIRIEYFAEIPVGQVAFPVGFRTVSYWVDRFHHYFLTFFGHKRSETRLHTVHFYRLAPNQILNVCDRNLRESYRPFFCEMPIKWTCSVPPGEDIEWASSDELSVSVHIMARLAQMQRRHPQLYFDVTVFASQMLSSNNNEWLRIATSLLVIQKNGITTIIRGRSCPEPNSEACETVLVDDYRYEREYLTTDVTQWYYITSFARAISQTYVWTRILFLWYGCYRARASEPKFQNSPILKRLWCACMTFFRIPSHMIIYSSWMPALGYAFAYFIDCNINHEHIDGVFAAVNGTFTFNFWKFLRLSCVQMRNVWLIALFFKSLTLVEINYLSPVADPWKWRHGLRSFNGQLVCCISALTIFAPMRRLEFRSTDVVSIEIVPANSVLKLHSMSKASDLIVEFGIRLDLQSIAQSCILLFLGIASVKLFLWVCDRLICPHKRVLPRHKTTYGRRLVYSWAPYMPLCVGTLTSRTAMSFYWDTTLINAQESSALRKLIGIVNSMPWVLRSRRRISTSPISTPSAVGPRALDVPWTHKVAKKFLMAGGRSVRADNDQELDPHSPRRGLVYKVERRTKAIWSMTRLINLALFTDPLTWFKIYFIGYPLYLYRVKSAAYDNVVSQTQECERLFLLPCTLNQLLESSLTSDEYDQGDSPYELIDTVNSTDVPWGLLLHCG